MESNFEVGIVYEILGAGKQIKKRSTHTGSFSEAFFSQSDIKNDGLFVKKRGKD